MRVGVGAVIAASTRLHADAALVITAGRAPPIFTRRHFPQLARYAARPSRVEMDHRAFFFATFLAAFTVFAAFFADCLCAPTIKLIASSAAA